MTYYKTHVFRFLSRIDHEFAAETRADAAPGAAAAACIRLSA